MVEERSGGGVPEMMRIPPPPRFFSVCGKRLIRGVLQAVLRASSEVCGKPLIALVLRAAAGGWLTSFAAAIDQRRLRG